MAEEKYSAVTTVAKLSHAGSVAEQEKVMSGYGDTCCTCDQCTDPDYDECQDCEGTGEILDSEGEEYVECTSCWGTGEA